MVEKRCTCGEARWLKCPDPWYLMAMRVAGKEYAPNLTRYAEHFLQLDITTKTEAEKVADQVRGLILAGTYVSVKDARKQPKARKAPGAIEPSAVLLKDARDRFYAARIEKHPTMSDSDKSLAKGRLRKFSEWRPVAGEPALADQPIGNVTLDVLLAFRVSSVVKDAAASTWAKYKTLLGQFFRWAQHEAGIRNASPFVGEVNPDDVRKLKVGKFAQRNRRINEAEEADLIEAARELQQVEHGCRRLANLLLAAFEGAMRKGELLALQWRDVDLDAQVVYVRAEERGARKTGLARVVPISKRWLADLKTITHNPAGEKFGRSEYVYGNAIGEKINSIDKAWTTTILRANKSTPTWNKKKGLDVRSRARLRSIGLHFHDIRHEAASRWLELGMDLGVISNLLGHTTVAQTAAYLHTRLQAPGEMMRAIDRRRAELEAEATRKRHNAVAGQDKLRTNAENGEGHAKVVRLVKRDKVSRNR